WSTARIIRSCPRIIIIITTATRLKIQIGCSVLLDVNDGDCWIWAPLNAKAENIEPGKRTRPKVKRHHHFGKSSPPTPHDDLTHATEQQKEVGRAPTTAPNLP
ncbi:unnamed protein product, partial [Brassica oleracea]